MNLPKKQGQRLIPEFLLKYNEDLIKNHPDPSAEWGGGGSTYTAGDGIDITNDEISVDDTIARTSDIPDVSNMVTTDTVQDITAQKTFKGNIRVTADLSPNVNVARTDSTHSATLYPEYLSITYGSSVLNPYCRVLYNFNEIDYQNKTNTSSFDNYTIALKDMNNAVTGQYIFKPGKTGEVAITSDIPTKTSDLTNDSGFITGVTWNDVTNKPTFATVATSGDYNDLINKPSIPTREVIFSRTPDGGTASYNITLTKDITQYDEVVIYFNQNDGVEYKNSMTFPQLAVGDILNITAFGNGTSRLYTKNDSFEVATTTSLVLTNSIQQRVGNNESTQISASTTQFRVRPYKIIGIKY